MKNILSTIVLASCVTFAQAQKIDRTKAPSPGPAPTINIGTPSSFTLENGLKVFVVENHKLPRVSFQLSVDMDPMLETGKVGYSTMAGDMLGAGTSNRTKAQIDSEIDFIGGSLSTTSSGIYASSLKKHSGTVLDVMSDIILNPSFPADELEKKKKKEYSNLKSLTTNPDAMLGRVKSVLLYGKDHPYGEVKQKSDLANITVEDCKAYYETYFRPNISYLVVLGDITPAEAKPMVEKYFAKWEKKEVPSHKYDVPSQPSKNRVAFVNKPGAVQSVISVTYPVDLKPGSDDAVAVSVMNSILGGGVFSGRLMQNLREDKAFTYGARSSIRPNKLVGSFGAGASVRNEVTDSAVNEFMYELNKMATTNITPEELSLVKNNMSGNFALSLENAQTIARFALNIQRYDLPADYYQTYLKKIEAVSIEDVRRVAEKYIKPNNAWIVVVGNDEVADKLSRFAGSGEVEFYDINGDLKVKKSVPLPEGLTADKVIKNYLFAITGEESMKAVAKKYKKVKDVTVTMEMEMQGMKIEMVSKQKAPNMTLTEINMMGNTVQKQVFDGSNGGSTGMQGKQKLEGDELEAAKHGAVMNKELRYDELGYKLELKSIEEVNGVEAYKVAITDPMGNEELNYFDTKSNLKVYTMSTETGPEGEEITVTTEFSDYKEVDGFKYAFKRLRTMGPQILDLNVKEVKVNTKLKASEFAWE